MDKEGTSSSHPAAAQTPPAKSTNGAGWWFWGVFWLVILLLLGFSIVANIASNEQFGERGEQADSERIRSAAGEPAPRDIVRRFWFGNESIDVRLGSLATLRREITARLQTGLATHLAQLDQAIDSQVNAVFEPVLWKIPEYLDWNYSLAGNYAQLFMAVAGYLGKRIPLPGEISTGLPAYLDGQFRERVLGIRESGKPSGFEHSLDQANLSFQRKIRAWKQRESVLIKQSLKVYEVEEPALNNDLTEVRSADVVDYIIDKIPDPIDAGDIGREAGASASALAAALGAKKLSVTVSKTVVSKAVATKGFQAMAAALVQAASGMAIKLGAASTSAGSAAVLCSPTGIAAVLCAAVAGVVTYVSVDAVIINIDELANRDELQLDLETAIVDARDALKKQLSGQYTKILLEDAERTRARIDAALHERP